MLVDPGVYFPKRYHWFSKKVNTVYGSNIRTVHQDVTKPLQELLFQGTKLLPRNLMTRYEK